MSNSGQAAQCLHFWECEVKICQVEEEELRECEQTAKWEQESRRGCWVIFQKQQSCTYVNTRQTRTHPHTQYAGFTYNNLLQCGKKITAHIKCHKSRLPTVYLNFMKLICTNYQKLISSSVKFQCWLLQSRWWPLMFLAYLPFFNNFHHAVKSVFLEKCTLEKKKNTINRSYVLPGARWGNFWQQRLRGAFFLCQEARW